MAKPKVASPNWGANTKLIVGLTIVAIIAALVIRFSNIIVPVLFTFIISYLLHPVIAFLENKSKLSWKMAVNVVYLLLLILAVGILIALGVALVQQLQNLVEVITELADNLPNIARNLSEEGFQYVIFGYTLDFTNTFRQLDIDFLAISEQILLVLKPILGQAGSLLGGVATSTFKFFGWGAFIFISSFFLLSGAGDIPTLVQDFEIPGLVDDVSRMGRETGRIWNAFLRGQVFLFITAVVGSFIVMAIAGIQNALGLAFLVGFAKFIPYVGPLLANVVVSIVALLQPSNYLNVEPLTLVLVVVGILLIMDQIFDNIVAPRLYGNVLGIHPAALLLTAIILSSLIGIAGFILAAPVLASLQMFLGYTSRKMLDQSAWKEPEKFEVELDIPFQKPLKNFILRIKSIITRKRNLNEVEIEDE